MISCRNCGEDNPERARFCWNCGRQLAAEALPAETRKTVTVLFCDVAGSTAIGEQADPESLRRVMARYFDTIRAVVERHGGTVEKFIGDAAMAVFGVPTVHEDDALRAVRAAIEIRDELADLSARIERERGITIAWRTGINTGEVVAGDAGAGQTFVTGDAVNVAARLEQAAQPTEILIGAATRELVRDAARLEPVPPVEAKGKAEPLRAFRLLGLDAAAEGPRRLLQAPMVGRQRPRRLLHDAWEQVVDERVCHLFTVLGAPGVGKSRLVQEFIDGLEEQATLLRGRCLSYGDGITYWPIAEVIRRAGGLTDLDDPTAARRKLAALFGSAAAAEGSQAAGRLAELIGLQPGSAAQDELFWAVRRMLQSIAARRPLVLVLDDLHWAEPTLLDLIDHLADWITDAPVMIVCLARRELLDIRPGWGGGKAHASTITLEPLDATESRELAGSLLGQLELGGHLVERITTAAEGNPLFVEEVIGMLIDRGELSIQDGRCVAVGDLSHVAVPPSIHALLAARIDGLDAPERAVLERASVEGQVFHRTAVEELAPPELREGVGQRIMILTRKDLVRPQREEGGGVPGDEAFRFRHLLIRDAAYGAMPKHLRAELHARFAGWLSRAVGDRLAEYEEILAYHYEQAYRYRSEIGPVDGETHDLAGLAALHLGESGRRALDRGDVGAAGKLLGRALEMLADNDPAAARLRADRASALAMGGQLQEADELLARAADGARAAGDELAEAYANVHRLEIASMLGGMTVQEGLDRAAELLPVFALHGDERGLDRATLELAKHHFFVGHAKQAEDILTDRLAARARSANMDALAEWVVVTLVWGPTPVVQAVRQIDDMLVAPPSRGLEAMACVVIGMLRAFEGDFESARDQAARGIAIREDLGNQIAAVREAGMVLGHIELLAGNADEAERVSGAAMVTLDAAGERGFASTVLAIRARAAMQRGQHDEAKAYAERAREMVPSDDVATHSLAARVEGRVLAMGGELVRAERRAREAVAMLERTDYIAELGEAHADLAEVLLAADNTAAAREALGNALVNFEAKGAIVLAERARRRIAELAGAEEGAR